MPIFVDSNVLVYARDTTEPRKQELAAAWLEHLWTKRTGRLSQQVLHEFYVMVTRKLDPGLDTDQARSDVRDLLAWRPRVIDREALEVAWTIEDRFGLSFWDALIVAAARIGGCERLLTEDLQDGADYDGVVIVDPFTHTPET